MIHHPRGQGPNSAYNRKYYLANKSQLRKRHRRYYLANRKILLAKEKAWKIANPEVYRQRQVLYKFGLTAEQYESLIKKQKGLCAICKRPSRSKRFKRLAVDHCHTTKKVRGLLCGSCNKAIGLFEDNPQILRRAIKYLIGGLR